MALPDGLPERDDVVPVLEMVALTLPDGLPERDDEDPVPVGPTEDVSVALNPVELVTGALTVSVVPLQTVVNVVYCGRKGQPC